MGKVIEILHVIRGMSDLELFNRFDHITCAKAIRDYLGEREDKKLTLEVHLAREEILKRMAERDPCISVRVGG